MRSCHNVPPGSTVFLRTGMDVPLDNATITDPARIEETRPTIDVLRSMGCKILVTTHIGRPKGTDPAFSAKPIADYLSKYYPVHFVPVVTGQPVHDALAAAKPGELVVIENLRYDEREEGNDPVFAQELVKDCDVIVQDAYSNCHRKHASMTAVLAYKPGYAGLLLEKELEMMKKIENPEHPYVAIIGGAKADKISTMHGMLDKVDVMLLGGALANTFLKAAGFPVGQSKVDDTQLVAALELFTTGKILLPIDVVVAEKFEKDSNSWTCDIGEMKNGMILDIGPKTIERYTTILTQAKTIVWAGPIGVFEWPKFSEGTKQIAAAMAATHAFTMAAGGDSGAALVSLGYKDKISHVSTGGGVTLQLLEGKELPAVVALTENEKQFP